MAYPVGQNGQDLLLDAKFTSSETVALGNDQQISTVSQLDTLLYDVETFSDEVASRPNLGNRAAPLDDLQRLHRIGLLVAAIPVRLGGLGLGTDPGCHLPLLRILSLLGGADIVLGRLFEGHLNALIMIASYGTELQLKQASCDAADGMLFGVWNTGVAEPLRLTDGSEDMYTFSGCKAFASGAAFVRRPIVTAEWLGHGWQMTLPKMESPAVSLHIDINQESWRPLGMEGSESYTVNFTGVAVTADDLVGVSGDFYRDPLFRGGAIRFAAVQAGAVIRLHRLFAEWLESRGRGNDPYQVARLGEIAVRSQAAVLWLERAASVAEQCLQPEATKLATERMVECANMTRVAIAEIATYVMQCIVTGVGAHGLLQPSPFEKIIRDLTMYLRQPSPDQALADIGKASLRKSTLRVGGAENYTWKDYLGDGSLPPRYFQQIYSHSKDPWDFETSQYESDKYQETLASLPDARYRRALEVGSSIGVFTKMLAKRCDLLLSIDVSERALDIARARCADQSNVTFSQVRIPGEVPAGEYNLILISEVAYYWSLESLHQCASMLAARQNSGDHLVLVHLTTPVADYPLLGDEVHETWLMRPEWRHLQHQRQERYRIDVLERCNVD